MNNETAQKTEEKPFEINNISINLPLVDEETENETEETSPKKPRESKVFNHGTGYATFVQATKLITASRSTLARYANEGKISFETDENGHKLFQIVELERIFGKLKSPETDEIGSIDDEKDHLAPHEQGNEIALKIAKLEADKQLLEALLDAEKEKGRLLEQNADDLRQSLKMLTYRPQTTPAAAPKQSQQPKGFLARLFGGNG